MLEEQERAMQADEDDFFQLRRREEKRGWFRRNKKLDYSSKLEKWELCEVSYKIILYLIKIVRKCPLLAIIFFY